MVAVVMEIVRTTSTAENAISVLATTPNFDFFIDLSLSSVEVHQQSHLEVAGEQRLTTVVSRSTGTAYVCSSGTDWERDWSYEVRRLYHGGDGMNIFLVRS